MFSFTYQFTRQVLWGWIFVIAIGSLSIWLASYWLGASTALELRETSRERLSLYEATLLGELDKYRYLPFVLSGNEDVKELLTTFQNDPYFANKVSKSLAETNNKAEANVLYIMDKKGNTLASSNWQDKTSFVGHNYSFRPYFQDAIEGSEGRFFAIGTISGIPGFFMSHPVYEDGSIIGVAVVKVNLTPLQQQWNDGGENVYITDENGVIFLASQKDWLYKSLRSIPIEQLQKLQRNKQYGESKFDILRTDRIKVAGDFSTKIEGERYLETIQDIANTNWKIHYLVSISPITENQRTIVAIGIGVIVTLLVLALFIRERREKVISTRRALEAEKMEEMNRQLEIEIEERRRTEKELRAAQDGLVQAGKLAALGQMSAAIAYEINQPIAAIQSYVSNCVSYLRNQDDQELNNSLTEISSLTEKMGMITAQLKNFARKSSLKVRPIDVVKAINKAGHLMQPVLKAQSVFVELSTEPKTMLISGDEIRLEQVFVNLYRNAVDAMKTIKGEKIITINTSVTDTQVRVIVSDTGTGLEKHVLNELYDPFFTTKSNSESLGLGLSITYGIIKDLKGEIQASNNPDGGACFVLSFPRYIEK
ncbi:sensor histidine kinase [Kiloniella spongiae]|uniref:sensor histidine kinase n=1 Tax=Kiloniella spongiae TaxID=1489064 RepID=UPI0006995681|nr:cache domain-containing protein [Kiloniella spongiae]